MIKKIAYICKVVQIKTTNMAATKTYKDIKAEQESKIVEHYASLMFQGFTNKEATDATLKKFNIYSRTTLWAIKKRVAEREKAKNKNGA